MWQGDDLHDAKEPSSLLLAGRRAIDGIAGAKVIQDLRWYERPERWALLVSLSPRLEPTEFVPVLTNWYVLIEDRYPRGGVTVLPAKAGGITATFQHQKLNLEGESELPWRTGELCLSTNLNALGRRGYDTEPADQDAKLGWHVNRALEWLVAASKGQLAEAGDPFELPPLSNIHSGLIIVRENAESFLKWNGVSDSFGFVRLGRINSQPLRWIVRDFRTTSGRVVLDCSWGLAMSANSEDDMGIWIRSPQIPIVLPWRFPITFGELRSSLTSAGISFDEICRSITGEQFRDGKRHFCLVGFPIADEIGASPSLMSWQSIMLPTLSAPNRNGFRGARLWERDRELVVSSGVKANWTTTENWDGNQIRTRGCLPSAMTARKTAIIGAGAVGAVLGELLVRGGVDDLLIVDKENLDVGNLSRHTLTMNDVDQRKASSLAIRLNSVSPHARVRGIDKPFDQVEGPERTALLGVNVVWDCTGNDDLLLDLEQASWTSQPIICSLSLSFGARRLYMYVQKAPFRADTFLSQLQPWLLRDLEERGPEPLPREGTGCWHPVFPASAVDIHLMVSFALKAFSITSGEMPEPKLVVFEQIVNNDRLVGVQQIGA